MNFIISGKFIIPLLIFVSVWFLTGPFAEFIFWGSNQLLSWVLRKRVVKAKPPGKRHLSYAERKLRKIIQSQFPVKLEKEWYLKCYLYFRKEFMENLPELKKECEEIKNKISESFILFFRPLIVIFIYFFSTNDMGTFLFITLCLTFFVIYVIQILFFQIIELIPVVIKKFMVIAEVKFAEYQKRLAMKVSENYPDNSSEFT